MNTYKEPQSMSGPEYLMLDRLVVKKDEGRREKRRSSSHSRESRRGRGRGRKGRRRNILASD